MMPFGLCGYPSTFLRLMSEVAQELTNIFTYLNDVTVFSSFTDDYKMYLSALFQCLAKYGLKVNKEKYRIEIEELDFLRHHITKKGFQSVRDQLEAIHMYPLPKTVKELRRFLGLHNYYENLFRKEPKP